MPKLCLTNVDRDGEEPILSVAYFWLLNSIGGCKTLLEISLLSKTKRFLSKSGMGEGWEYWWVGQSNIRLLYIT